MCKHAATTTTTTTIAATQHRVLIILWEMPLWDPTFCFLILCFFPSVVFCPLNGPSVAQWTGLQGNPKYWAEFSWEAKESTLFKNSSSVATLQVHLCQQKIPGQGWPVSHVILCESTTFAAVTNGPWFLYWHVSLPSQGQEESPFPLLGGWAQIHFPTNVAINQISKVLLLSPPPSPSLIKHLNFPKGPYNTGWCCKFSASY